MIIWTLTNGGMTKPFASWGAMNPQVTFRSLDDDELIFTVQGDVFTTCPFAYGNAISLARDGVTKFIGTVTSVAASGSPKDMEWRVVCSGPWYQLRTIMYQQIMAAFDGSCGKTTPLTTKLTLFGNPTNMNAITTGAQITAAINYAITLGVAIASGTAPAFVNVPIETARELTVADVIRRSLQWTPDAVGWFDYSSGVPVFNCQVRASLTVTTLDFMSDPALITHFDLKERNDLVPSGVRFNFIGKRNASCNANTGAGTDCPTPVEAGGDQPVVVVTAQSAGLPDIAGGVIGTVDLPTLADGTSAPVPSGLALAYYGSLLTVPWEGSVTTRELQCSGTMQLGHVLCLSNGNASWVTMNGLLQQVTETLLTGETTGTFGPPSHLTPQDFSTLVQMTRRRALTMDGFVASKPPKKPDDTDNCDQGLDPAFQALKAGTKAGSGAIGTALQQGSTPVLHTQSIDICVDGEVQTIALYGPPHV